MSDKLVNFRGTKISREEAYLIEELEKKISIKLSCISSAFYQSSIFKNCFTVGKNHIIGIYLENLDLKKFPEVLMQFKHLIHISLKSNNLKDISELIQKRESLEAINLARNKFKIFPESILQHSKLLALNLSNNIIKSIPKSFKKLENLESLNLSFNKINSIPESLGELKKLRNLYLDGNPIKSIPESLFQNNLLKKIAISERNLDGSSKTLINQIKNEFNQFIENNIPEEKRYYSNIEGIKKLNVITAPYRIEFFYEYGSEMFWSRNFNSCIRFGSPIDPYDLPLSREIANKFKKFCEIWIIKMYLDRKHKKEEVPSFENIDDWDWERLQNETTILLEQARSELGEEFDIFEK